MTKRAFDKIAAGLSEAADVAAIIAERDAAIRERDEEMKWVERYSEEDDRTRRAIGDEFTLVPPDGGDVKTHEAAESLRAALDEARATNTRLRAIIARCATALGNGAFIADGCSDDFRERLTDEISYVVARLTRERDEARAALASARDSALAILAEWRRADHMRLHCGEMTAQEVRTVRAVLDAVAEMAK